MDFPQEIPAQGGGHHQTHAADARRSSGRDRGLTLKGSALGAAGGDEIERDVWRPADVLVREASTLAFAAATHHPLAEEVRPPDHEDQQDDGDDGHDGVGAAVGAVGGRVGV